MDAAELAQDTWEAGQWFLRVQVDPPHEDVSVFLSYHGLETYWLHCFPGYVGWDYSDNFGGHFETHNLWSKEMGKKLFDWIRPSAEKNMENIVAYDASCW